MKHATPLPHHTHPHTHAHAHDVTPSRLARPGQHTAPMRSVLAWPAWLRVAAVLPVVLALWLAVWWANEGVALW